jgi:hypothetical protein
MIKSITNNQQSLLRGLTAGLFALMLAVFAMPAQAQMDDGELPKIDFSVNLMQGAQYLIVDQTGNDDPQTGFHAARAGLNSSVQFSENVYGLLMLEAEPNDFAGIGAAGSLQPSVDFMILNLDVTDQLTIQTGTPVTGLMNFRGFSDGPVVQGNPLIGNSVADMITAGQGVKLIGSYGTFGFDVTVNRNFGESITTGAGGNTGVNLIAKARYTGAETFKIGGGIATATGAGVTDNGGPDDSPGSSDIIFANGDRENYNVNGATNTTATHANIPAGFIGQVDGKVMVAGADIDAWLGYGTESDVYGGNDDAYTAIFGGLGLKYDLTEDFYAAGRVSYAGETSEAVSSVDNTSTTRFQLGVGYMVYDKALLKVEYVNQSEGDTRISQVGNNWQGVSTELSFNF